MSTAKPYYIMTENGKQKLEAMMDDIPQTKIQKLEAMMDDIPLHLYVFINLYFIIYIIKF